MACGSSAADSGGTPGVDSGAPTTDGGDETLHEDGPATDAPGDVPIGDGAALDVRCSGSDGPYFVVTRPASGSGTARTLLRVPLWLSRGASEVKITKVSQRAPASMGDPGKELRAWDASKLIAPAGFAGIATPKPGMTTAEVTFTEVQDALDADTAQCASSIEKRGGSLHVEGSTKEGGAFAIDCAFGSGGVGATPGALPFACAKGVAGWLGGSGSGTGGLGSMTVPVSAALADSALTVHDTTSTTITSIVATDFTAKAMRIDMPMLTCAAPPGDWSPSGGTHQVWRGASSSDIWSGPVAPDTEEAASWMWQIEPGAVPDGFINGPSTGDPTKTCPPVNARFLLRGTSSAGAWEWEGPWFVAYRPK